LQKVMVEGSKNLLILRQGNRTASKIKYIFYPKKAWSIIIQTYPSLLLDDLLSVFQKFFECYFKAVSKFLLTII